MTLLRRGSSLALLLAVGLMAAACSRDEEPPPQDAARQAEARKSLDDAAAEADQEARQTDAQFKGSPFGSVVRDLPIGKPPLGVRQYIVDEGEHGLTARVPADDFLCGRAPEARRAAVASFYRDASRRFRARGVDDLDLTVAVLTDDVDDLRVLARARRGETALTARGRAPGRC